MSSPRMIVVSLGKNERNQKINGVRRFQFPSFINTRGNLQTLWWSQQRQLVTKLSDFQANLVCEFYLKLSQL